MVVEVEEVVEEREAGGLQTDRVLRGGEAVTTTEEEKTEFKSRYST